MSLRVWLPLNKDLKNQGLSNVNVTNNGATFSDGCANFTTSQYISLPITSLTHSSVSFWIKLPTSKTTWLPFSNNGGKWLMACDGGGNFYFSSDVTGQKIIYMDGQVVTKMSTDGNWHHYCIVDISFSGWSAFYINHYNSSTYNWSGQFYDFRIYDHALSKKEVAELARGCVLHYPMNDTINESTVNYGRILENIVLESTVTTPSDWLLEKLDRDTFKITATVDSPSIAASSSVPNYIIWNVSNLYRVEANTTVTLSCEIVDYKGSLDRLCPCVIGFGKIIGSNGYSRIGNVVSKTITHNAAWSFRIGIGAYDNTNIHAGDYLIIRNTQIELKDHATPYTPSSRAQTQLKDVSGFDNSIPVLGSLPLVTDKGARYECVMNVDNTGTTRNYAWGDLNAIDVKSASFWVNVGASFPANSKFIFLYYPSHITFGFYANNYCIVHNTPQGSAGQIPSRFEIKTKLKYNDWNHIVINHLGTTTEMWLNGEKLPDPVSEWWSNSNHGLIMFSRGENESFTGKVSDFRLFSRVLTQADVDDLYKDSLSIDKSQNGYCYELNESDAQSSVDVKKNGQLVCKNYSEDFDALYLPAGTYVDILMDYAVGDTWKAETFIKYDANGSGRDLMGVSGNGSNYWGVTADGTWELHGIGTYTNADITKYNKIIYTYTIKSGELGGNYQVGALRASRTNRNKTIYHTRLWKNGVLERDLYPCSINNQVGLIDGLTGTFYPVQKLSSTGIDASLVSGIPEARLGKTGVTMNEIHEI